MVQQHWAATPSAVGIVSLRQVRLDSLFIFRDPHFASTLHRTNLTQRRQAAKTTRENPRFKDSRKELRVQRLEVSERQRRQRERLLPQITGINAEVVFLLWAFLYLRYLRYSRLGPCRSWPCREIADLSTNGDGTTATASTADYAD
jgi:hypothetical protein